MHHDETKQRAHDSQIVRTKENLKLSLGGPSYSQASGTNPTIQTLRQSRHWVEAWPIILQLKRNHIFKPWLSLKPGMQTVAWYPSHIQLVLVRLLQELVHAVLKIKN